MCYLLPRLLFGGFLFLGCLGLSFFLKSFSFLFFFFLLPLFFFFLSLQWSTIYISLELWQQLPHLSNEHETLFNKYFELKEKGLYKKLITSLADIFNLYVLQYKQHIHWCNSTLILHNHGDTWYWEDELKYILFCDVKLIKCFMWNFQSADLISSQAHIDTLSGINVWCCQNLSFISGISSAAYLDSFLLQFCLGLALFVCHWYIRGWLWGHILVNNLWGQRSTIRLLKVTNEGLLFTFSAILCHVL